MDTQMEESGTRPCWFVGVALAGSDWRVYAGQIIKWPVAGMSPGMGAILPTMMTDIVLENPVEHRRVVIDTKFNEVVVYGSGWYRDQTLRSGYLYQMYAYLRSQEEDGTRFSPYASGLLLHPAIHEMVDEYVVIQGHPIRFATVDLAGPATSIRARLLALLDLTLTKGIGHETVA